MSSIGAHRRHDSFTAETSFEAFCLDGKTLYAVVHALEIISEASRRLPDELVQRHTEIDWQAIAAAGNIYRHEYDAVDEALLWHTIKHDLAPLRRVVDAELRQNLTDQPPGGSSGELLP